MLSLELGVEEGYCSWNFPGESAKEARVVRIQAPKDGKIPPDFLEFTHDAFARVFERFLLIAGAIAPSIVVIVPRLSVAKAAQFIR